jgi:hypothetical protein
MEYETFEEWRQFLFDYRDGKIPKSDDPVIDKVRRKLAGDEEWMKRLYERHKDVMEGRWEEYTPLDLD